MLIQSVVSIVTLVVLSLVLYNWLLPKAFAYQVDDAGVGFIRFRRFRRGVLWGQIAEVDVESLIDLILDNDVTGFNARWWTNRVCWRYVVIRGQDSHLYVLSPRAPEAFARAVREHVQLFAAPSN